MGTIKAKCQCGNRMKLDKSHCPKCWRQNKKLGMNRTFLIYYRWKGSDKNETIGYGRDAYRIAGIKLAAIDKKKMENKHLDIDLNEQITIRELFKWYLNLNEIQMMTSYFKARNHIEEFGNRMGWSKKVSEITPYLIEWDRKRRLEEIKPGSYDVEFRWFKSMLTKAVRHGELSSNPIKFVYAIDADNTRNVFLTDEEVEKLFKCIKIPWLKHVCTLAYRVPMRRMEMLKLTWDEVNLQRGEIRLYNDRVKGKKGRTIPLPPDIKEMFNKLPNIHDEFVFGDRAGSELQNNFRRAREKAGLPDFHFHDFRHIAINNMRAKGNPDHIIMAISGHKSRSNFLRYTYTSEVDVKGVKW